MNQFDTITFLRGAGKSKSIQSLSKIVWNYKTGVHK